MHQWWTSPHDRTCFSLPASPLERLALSSAPGRPWGAYMLGISHSCLESCGKRSSCQHNDGSSAALSNAETASCAFHISQSWGKCQDSEGGRQSR